jgi:hypothetical protein
VMGYREERTLLHERFQFLTAASMKFRVFWDVAPCSQVEADRRFRSTYCLHHRDDRTYDGGSTSETSVNFILTTRRYISEDYKLNTSINFKDIF